MKKVKIKIGFAGITLTDLQSRKNEIVKAMTGNAYFPGTVALVQNVDVKGKEFDDLLVQIRLGDKTLIARRDVVYVNLINLLTELGDDVTAISKGDYEMLSSTGFGLYKQREPAGSISAPLGLTLADNELLGGFKAKVQKVTGAMSYQYEWSANSTEPSAWESVQVGYVTHNITGLESGKKYNVRVGAVDKNGEIAYSSLVSRIAQ